MPDLKSSSDLVLVGGGLANCLIAYRLRMAVPDCRVLVLERADRLGGEHTWSFHAGDLSEAQHAWISPLVEHRWSQYDVLFPRHQRRLDAGYASFGSDRLHALMMDVLGDRVHLGVEVISLLPDEVGLGGGRRVEAAVIDGRGKLTGPHLVLRFQKFLGQVVELNEPHGLTGPTIMDARVEQVDGYRFVYVLPYGERTALIEDTRYSDTPELLRSALRQDIRRYVRARGWRIDRVEREEQGVLPIVLSGDIHAFWAEAEAGVARSGLRAGLFHPTTGYSLPEAVRLADSLVSLMRSGPVDGVRLHRWTRQRSLVAWERYAFCRMLNRLLFLAGGPAERYRILERFYRLPEALIRRFYAGHLTIGDRVRLLTGRPPVPFGAALRSMWATGAERGPPVASSPSARRSQS